MVHIQHDTFGEVIKKARQRSNLTMEELADRPQVSSRYLYRLENEGKKPSYDLLFALIRELSIPPDLIFYPKKQTKNSEMESLIRQLYNCDERSLEVIKATVSALIETVITNDTDKK